MPSRNYCRRVRFTKMDEVDLILTWFVDENNVLFGYAGSKAFV